MYTHAMKPPLSHRFWRWFYNRTAFAYDAVLKFGERLRLGSEERIRAELFAAVRLRPGAVVVDVGSGTGSLLAHVPAGITYVGVDASLNMLRRARRKYPKQSFVLADAASLPIALRGAEFAVAMGVLQHTADPAAAIAQLRRVAVSVAVADEHHAYQRICAGSPSPKTVRSYKDYFVLFFQN